jgi:hypothetical protein
MNHSFTVAFHHTKKGWQWELKLDLTTPAVRSGYFTDIHIAATNLASYIAHHSGI